MRYAAIFCAAALAAPSTLTAQAVSIDEGSFTITRGGNRVGREDFVIRRTPGAGGDNVVATSTVAIDDRRITTALQADSSGAPLRYQVEVKNDAGVQERLKGQIGGGRISLLTRTPSGEAAKEYVVTDGAIVLDDDVFHQYYFLNRVRGGSVPVIVPRRNVQVTMRIEERGTVRLSIGGSSLQARLLVLTDPSGAARQVWLDPKGRVLKVALDDKGLAATRDEPPR